MNNRKELVSEIDNEVDKTYFSKSIGLIDLIETYQGEGPNCGKKMVLARFKYCNKKCPFCDTQKMMEDLKTTSYSLKDIDILLKKSPNLMITGGEPTLNVKSTCDGFTQIESTKLMMKYLNYEFLDIETNGYNLKDLCIYGNDIINKQNKHINISWSPKFVDDGDYIKNVEILKSIIEISEYSKCLPIIKIVIGNDMDEYKTFIYNAVLKYKFNNNNVYLMPKGTTLNEINESMELVLQVASDLSCNVSSRLHILHNFK